MGQPQRLVYPTDSQGRLCGVHEAVADRPFLLFFDLVKCAQVVSVTEVLSGDFDASAIFTCPTPQVGYHWVFNEEIDLFTFNTWFDYIEITVSHLLPLSNLSRHFTLY